MFWPLWVSPQRIGTHSFQVALYYERGAAAGGRILAPMRHRVLCIGHSISVVPALKVREGCRWIELARSVGGGM